MRLSVIACAMWWAACAFAAPSISSFTCSTNPCTAGSTLTWATAGTTEVYLVTTGNPGTATSVAASGSTAVSPTYSQVYQLQARDSTAPWGLVTKEILVVAGTGTLAPTFAANLLSINPTTVAITRTPVSGSFAAYSVWEGALTVSGTYANPQEQVIVRCTFTAPSSAMYTVGATYDNGGIWRVRFAPMEAGTYNYTYVIGGPSSYATGSGTFTTTAGTSAGYLAVNPSNSKGFITAANSKAFYPIGLQGQEPPVGSTVNIYAATRGLFAPKPSFTTWVANYGAAGFNFNRCNSNCQQTAYMVTPSSVNAGTVNGTAPFANTGANNYNVANAQQNDISMVTFWQNGWHSAYNNLPQPNCLPNGCPSTGGYDVFTNPVATMAFLKAKQYELDRLGPFADIWELINEDAGGTLTTPWLNTVATYIHQHDPYGHLVSVSPNNISGLSLASIDIVQPHYYNPNPYPGASLASAGQEVSTITSYQSSYAKPMYMGESGNSGSTPDGDPNWHQRHRIDLWSLWTQGVGAVQWLSYAGDGTCCQSAAGAIFVGDYEREQTAIFSNFVKDFDGAAVPATITVTPSGTDTVSAWALRSSADIGAYLYHTNNNTTAVAGSVTVNVPASGMRGYWMDPATGVTLGTFTTAGTGNQTYTIPAGFVQDIVLRITTNAAPVISISPTGLPGATQAASYSQTLTASGGTAPYTFSIAKGSLPAGLSMSSAGVITGAPTGAYPGGNGYIFTVQVTDSASHTVTYPYSIQVANVPNVISVTDKTGTTTTNFPFQFSRIFSDVSAYTDSVLWSPQVGICTDSSCVAISKWLSTDVTVKQTYPSGYIKQALFTVLIPTETANTATYLTFRNAQNFGTATALTASQVVSEILDCTHTLHSGTFGFDAVIQTTANAVAQSASARNMLGTCASPGTAFTVWAGNGSSTGWNRTNVATTVIIADHSAAAAYDWGYKDKKYTALKTSITSTSALSVTVASAVDIVPLLPAVIQIDSEHICVVNASGNTLTVGTGCTGTASANGRGWDSSTAGFHYHGAAVNSLAVTSQIEASPDNATKSLRPIFEATFYWGTNQVFVKSILENANSTRFADQGPYSLSVSLGQTPTTVYTATTVKHAAGMRWAVDRNNQGQTWAVSTPSGSITMRKATWLGGVPPAAAVDYGFPYLISTNYLPNYDLTKTVPESVIQTDWNNFTSGQEVYTSSAACWGLGTGSLGNQGSSPWDGPVPLWWGRYLASGDIREQELVQECGNQMGLFSVHFREGDPARNITRSATNGCASNCSAAGIGKMMTPTSRLTVDNEPMNYSGTLDSDAITITAANNTLTTGNPNFQGYNTGFDSSHLPDCGSLPYLIGGDPYYLEEQQFCASYAVTSQNPGTTIPQGRGSTGAEGAGGYNGGEIRSVAWLLRAEATCQYISPDNTPEKSACQSWVDDLISAEEGARCGSGDALAWCSSSPYHNKQQWSWGISMRAKINGPSGCTPGTNCRSYPSLHQWERNPVEWGQSTSTFLQGEYGINLVAGTGTMAQVNSSTVSISDPTQCSQLFVSQAIELSCNGGYTPVLGCLKYRIASISCPNVTMTTSITAANPWYYAPTAVSGDSQFSYDYFGYALGHASEMGFAAGNLRDWVGTYYVGMATASGANPRLLFSGRYVAEKTSFGSDYLSYADMQSGWLSSWQGLSSGYAPTGWPVGTFGPPFGYAALASAATSYFTNLSNGQSAWNFFQNNVENDPSYSSQGYIQWNIVPRAGVLSPPPPCSVQTATLPAATAGTPYSQTLVSANCTAPLTWSITSGVLPGGLSLNASTGAISGTPITASAASAITFQVRDSTTATANQSISLTVGNFGYTPPALPQATVDVTMPARTGALTAVHAGADLQAALNAASCGDWLVLDAGATWSGNYTFSQSCNSANWIVVTTSGSLPFPGNRIQPSTAAGTAIITTPNSNPAIASQAGASYWRFIGIQAQLGTGVTGAYYLACAGQCNGTAQTDANRPNHIIFDRIYIPGAGDFLHSIQHAVALNCDYCGVVDSYLAGIWGTLSSDSQAIVGWDGRGPFLIHNDYLEAASENADFGGAMPTLTGVVPSDLTFSGNYVRKLLTWKGAGLNTKNLLEFKSMNRADVEGNIFENCWTDGQAGTAIMLTVRTSQSGSWAVVKNVTFKNNIVRHASSGLEMTGYDDADSSHGVNQGGLLLAQNNLFYDLNSTTYGGDGRQFQFYDTVTDVTLLHNTTDSTTVSQESGYGPLARLYSQDNIYNYGAYGLNSASVAFGTAALNADFSPWWFGNNVVYHNNGSYPYPANGPNCGGNCYPSSVSTVLFTNTAAGDYSLQSGSPYHIQATDGTDIGVNMTTLNAATLHTIDGQTAVVPTSGGTLCNGIVILNGTATQK